MLQTQRWVYNDLQSKGRRIQPSLLTWHTAFHMCLPFHISFGVPAVKEALDAGYLCFIPNQYGEHCLHLLDSKLSQVVSQVD